MLICYSTVSEQEQIINKKLPTNQLQTYTTKIPAFKITQPYWLAQPHGIGMYTISDQRLVGNPENPDIPKMSFEM